MKKKLSLVALMAVLSVALLPGSGNVALAANPESVTVSATVTQNLTLSVTSNTLALGTLSTSSYSTAATTASVTTNAVNGGQLDVTATGLKTGATAAHREIGVTDINGTVPQTSATDYYKISTNASPSFTDTNATLTAAGGTDVVASQTIYDGTGPVSAATTQVTVGSKIAALTEAGSYSDTMTFTLTANP